MEEEEETAQERQSNELLALKVSLTFVFPFSFRTSWEELRFILIKITFVQSIFADQLVDCNEKSAEWKPLDIILTVFPSREHSGPPEIHVQLDLHITACADYPNKYTKLLGYAFCGVSYQMLINVFTVVEFRKSASKMPRASPIDGLPVCRISCKIWPFPDSEK